MKRKYSIKHWRIAGWALCLNLLVPLAWTQNFMEPQQNDPQLATYVSKTALNTPVKITATGAVITRIDPQPQNLDQVMQAIGYPIKAREAGVQGTVLLAVQVSATGAVLQAHVLRSPHTLLSDAVLAHASSIQFAPGQQGGQPTTLWVQVPLRFRLF